ncbi:MAG: hypothetical protein EOO93_02645 [Pedobacter sp.]|nr:MAG: hypothetical protein EOO93_02645 [Pedobacter sp.]
MNSEVIDKLVEGNATCFLIKAKLADYIKSLPEDYRSYEIQREIVNNTYLDNLIQTILDSKHIPQMVLVADSENLIPNSGVLNTGTFKILDGLQRTFRLKVIYDTISLAVVEIEKSSDILSLSRIHLSKYYKEKLDKINSTSSLLYKVFGYYKSHQILKAEHLFELFDRWQWFELWVNLEPKDQVNKMLVLNAGHKAVKTQHQLELLFNNLIPLFKKLDLNGFELIREKEVTTISFSKRRVEGQFHFSHLINAILSFNAGKPLTNNVILVQKTQSEEFDDALFDKLIHYEFLYKFIKCLLYLDSKISKIYGDLGIKWLGRDTTLTGIFAAAGNYAELSNLSSEEALENLERKIGDNPGVLRLDEFEFKRNSLDLAKVNIGSVNKRAIFRATNDILTNQIVALNWDQYFSKEL